MDVVANGPEYTLPEHENLPPGTYEAVLAGVEARTRIDEQEIESTYWSWQFILEHDGREIERTANSSPKLTPKSKGGKWARAIYGGDLPVEPGQRFDWACLLGRECLVAIEHVTTSDGVFDRITDVVGKPKRPAR